VRSRAARCACGRRNVSFVSATKLSHPDQAQPELFLNELGVVEAYRGQGIGSALVERLWDVARGRGCRGMWVLTDDANWRRA